MYDQKLIELVRTARANNQDLRFGQLLFNALSLWDQTNYDDNTYNENFHSRLFYIEDVELAAAISEWYTFVETYKQPQNTGDGLLHEPSDTDMEGQKDLGS